MVLMMLMQKKGQTVWQLSPLNNKVSVDLYNMKKRTFPKDVLFNVYVDNRFLKKGDDA